MVSRWRALALFAALVTVSGYADEGSTSALVCSGCHSENAAVPPLGTDAERIATLMLAFRAGTRTATVMNRIARGYTEAEIVALAKALTASGNADD